MSTPSEIHSRTLRTLARLTRNYTQAVYGFVHFNQEHNLAAHQNIDAAIEAIQSQVQAIEGGPINAGSFHEIAVICQEQIRTIQATFRQAFPPEQINSLLSTSDSLINNLDLCDRIYNDILANINQPIGEIINTDWAKEVITFLVYSNDRYALTILSDLLTSKNEWGIEVFDQLLQISEVNRACNDVLRSLSAKRDVEALQNCMLRQKSPAFVGRCIEICRERPNEFRPLVLALSNVIAVHPWAYSALREKYLLHHCTHLVEALCVLARPPNKADLQNIIIVLATECPEGDLIHPRHPERFLANEINQFKTSSERFPLNRMQQVLRILDLNTVTFQRAGMPQRPSLLEFSVEDRMATKILQIRREQELIQFLLGGLVVGNPPYRPCSTFLSTVKEVFIGNNCGHIFFQPELQESLERAGVKTLTFSARGNPVPQQGKMHLCEVDEAPSMWIQDACFTAHSRDKKPVMIIPRLIETPDVLNREAILAARRDRVRMQGFQNVETFNDALGSRAATGQQIYMIHAARILDPTLKSTHLAITYNEGGNELIGTFWNGNPHGATAGEAYMLIGKDSFDLNFRLLNEECKRIGLTFQNGAWTLVEPSQQLEVNLTRDHLRAILAKDRGISSLNYIFPHEQPDYHSDTSMCIGANGVVVINSTEAAWKKQQLFEIKRRRSELKRVGDSSLPDEVKSEYSKYIEESEGYIAGEEIARRELQGYGFVVKSVAGRFKCIDVPSNARERADFVNFFNFLSLRTPQPISKKLFISLGCTEEYTRECEQFIHHSLGVPDAQIVFLRRDESELLLKSSGGVRCTIKRCAIPFIS